MLWKGSIWFLLTAGVTSQEFSLHPEWWNETAKRGFKPRIPDFYQHQYYSTGQTGDTDQRPDWEPSGGWCMPTALTNCLYYWDTFNDGTGRPYDGLLGDDIDEQDDWLDAMCEEIKNLTSLFSGDSFQDVLNRRVAGKLTHTQHIVGDDGKVSYKSSEDSTTKEENITAFDAIKRNLLAGNDVMLRLWAPPVSAGKYDSDLWWAGRLNTGKRTGGPRNSGSYHFVTVAGIDCDKKQIYFADPDSNKGSDDAHAGWRANLPGVAGRKYGDDDDKPPVPECDQNKPKSEPTDWEKYYSCVTMDEDGATFKDDPAVNKRYACIKIEKIEVIAPTAACPEEGGGGRALMAALSSFLIRTPSTVFSVDRFIFYPTVPVDPLTIGSWRLTDTPVGDVWSATFLDPSTSDPLGNLRPNGGIEFKLDSGFVGLAPWLVAKAVVGTDVPFDKWDIVAHVMGGAPDEWLVQAHGFEEDPYEETSLDPEEEPPTSSPTSAPTRAPTPDVQPDDEEECEFSFLRIFRWLRCVLRNHFGRD